MQKFQLPTNTPIKPRKTIALHSSKPTAIEQKLDYKFQDYNILDNALIHRSYRTYRGYHQTSNERLEFLGDAVLELSVSNYLYHKYPGKPEGELTKIRSSLVRAESLVNSMKELDLPRHIRMSVSERKSGGEEKEYILGNVFEAIIGAIYLDRGYKYADAFINRTILKDVDSIIKKMPVIDPKTHLQEITQSQYKEIPKYKIVEEKGAAHEREFTAIVIINGKQYARGTGNSKQKAEEDCARKALVKLQKFM